MSTGGIVLVALVIAVGLVGILVPLLPGSVLVFAAIAVWAFLEKTTLAWATLGIATAILAAALLVKYLWPARRMKNADVGTWSLLAGGVLGIVGFFVVPVVGLVLGFVLGLWLAEWARLGDARLAWPSTTQALRAVGLALLVELAAALSVTGVWLIGLAVT